MKSFSSTQSRAILASVLSGVVGIGVIGCGGSGSSAGVGSTSGGGATANPYTGTYSGQFIDQNDLINTCTMQISSLGVITGTFNYTPAMSFSGTINSSGTGSIQDSNGTLPITLGASGLSTLGCGIGTSTEGFFATFISNPNGQFSGLSGQYAGTVHNTTLGATGIIALSISSSGVVAGVDLFNVSGKPTLEPVSGNLSSSGHLVYVVDGVTVNGDVSLAGNTITGGLQESNGNSATLSVSQVTP